MLNRIRSEQGASMLYVMAALIVTSFLSIALLKMSGSGNMAQSFYSSSASARSAAKSGLIAAVTYLENNNTPVLALLNDWRNSTLNGTPITTANTTIPPGTSAPIPLDLGSTNPQSYFVEVLAFDPTNMTIALKSTGTGKGNSRASVTAVYNIEGLIIDAGIIPTNALHMGGGGGEFNRAMDIHGDTYIKGCGYFYDDHFQTTDFHGKVHVGYEKDSSVLFKGVEFNDYVYFEGNALISQFQNEIPDSIFNQAANKKFPNPDYDPGVAEYRVGPLTNFHKSVGIERDLTITSGKLPGIYPDKSNEEVQKIQPVPPVTVKTGTLMSNGSIFLTDKNRINLATAHVNASGKKGSQTLESKNTDAGSPNQYIYNTADLKTNSFRNLFANGGIVDSTTIDIPITSTLGFGNPPEIGWDISGISPIHDIHTIRGYPWKPVSGAALDSMYNSLAKYKDASGDEWLVLRYTKSPDGRPFVSGGTPFNGRVIWIIEGKLVTAQSEFYEHSNSAISVLYVGTGAQLDGIGGCDKFRGLIYSTTTKKNTYKALSGTSFHGAIYQKEASGRLRIEGHPNETQPLGRFEVHYDAGIMSEIASLGILFDESVSGTPQLQIRPGATIQANILSQSI